MTSLDSVRPSPVDVKPGPPGAVATAGPPKSMARFGRGAGATGAPTSVSPEKSIARPPNGSGATGVASSTEVSVAAPGFVPFRPDGLAVAAQDLPLVMDVLGPAEDVRCVGVLGHKPKRLPLAAAADHDRNARARDRLRRVEQPGGTELATVEGALGAGFALEHLVRDPEGLLGLLEADAQR